MDQALFSKGYTTIKMFKPKTMFREGKIINPFLVVNRNKFVNYLIPSPPHFFWTEYKALRSKNKDIAIRRRNDQKIKKDEIKNRKTQIETLKLKKQEERLNPKDNEQPVSDIDQKHRDWRNHFMLLIPELIELKAKTGKEYNALLPRLARNHGISDKAVLLWRREGLLAKHNVGKS
jgi:hypothetical protein